MKVGIIILFSLMLLFQRSESVIGLTFMQEVTLNDYHTLQTNIHYSIPITFESTSIPANSNILLQFSNHYLINTVTGCTYSIGGAAAIATICNPTYSSGNQKYQINFPNIYNSLMSSQVGITLTFTIDNPYLAILEKIDVYLMTGTTVIGSGQATVTYIASPLNNCSFISSSDVTGVSSTRTISFIPSVQLKQNSVLVITLPAWFGSMANEATGSLVCTNKSNSDSSFPTCTASSVDQDLITMAYYQNFNVYYLISSDKTLNQAISFTMASLKNPYSQNPFGPIIFQLKAYDDGVGTQLFTSQSCTNIYQTSSTLGIPTSLSAVLPTTLNISTSYASRTVRFRILNPFPSLGGQFFISYPSTVRLLHSGSFANTNSTINTTTSTTFTSISANDITTVSNITINQLTFITPPSSRPFTLTFRTQVSTSGSIYGIQQSTQNYACQKGTLTSVILTPGSVNVNVINNYKLSFKTSNNLVSGSFIEVYFPSEVTPTVGACTTNISGLTCTVTNTSLATILISVSVSSNTQIQMVFTDVKNPKQALTTSSFRIYTYYDSGIDSIVDTVTSGITLTSIPNAISTAISAPTVTPNSFITYALTTYTFTATLSDFIPASGYISIGFPSTITFSSVALASASFTNGSCQINVVNTTIVNINNCFAVDMTSLNMSLTLSGILNPPSLQPTTSFSIATFGPLGQVNYISTGLEVTMKTPATSTAFSISPLSFIVHTFTKYTLGFTFAVPHSVNDYFDLSIPSSMAFSASPICSQVSGFSGISCGAVNTTTIRITITAQPLAVSAMSIQNIRNYDIATSLSYSITIYNTLGHAMESTLSSTIAYTPQTITAPTINSNDQIALNQNSNITITINSPFAMHSSFLSSLTSVSIIAPSPDFTITSNTTCSASFGTCTASNNTIKISSVGLSLSSFIISISQLLLSNFSPTSNSLTINYQYNNTQVATINTGAVVSVYCTSPCERCVSTRVACASCLPSPNTFIYYFGVNSSCLLSCPPKYYNDTGYICKACLSPCSECLDSANCTKCTNTTYLFGSSCLSVCPGTYYGNSSNVCASCVSPCFNCTSSTSCTSCAINFYTNSTCVNATSCPAGTYGNTNSSACDPCTNPCSTCFTFSTNCTSCVVGKVLYQNQCLGICPPTFYNSSTICVPCVAPCGNCTSNFSCTSCASDFLINSSCVAADKCPVGTYGNVNSSACDSCTSPCSTCFSFGTNCTSCMVGKVLYQNQCLGVCPPTFYNSSAVCVSCVSPCGNCTSNFSCTSCTTDFLTNSSCVSADKCPAGTFGDVNSSTCAACSSLCATCFGSKTNCTSCTGVLVYFQNQCLSSCPPTYYNSTKVCTSCQVPCGNCTSLNNCLSCQTNFLLGTACVNSLSCPNGTFADNITNTCTTCPTSCSGCLSSGTCTSCKSTFVFYNNTCISVCPDGTFKSGQNCLSCSLTCYTCSGNMSRCTSCASPQLLVSFTCIGGCPNGTYSNGVTCVNCPLTCQTCANGSSCTGCTGNLFYNNGSCISICPSGTFKDLSSNTCTSCDPSCFTCSSSPSNCSTCPTSSVFFSGTCVPFCPSNYFNISGTCKTCAYCQTCTTVSTCSQCLIGYYLFNSACYSFCPSNSITDANSMTCIPCDPSCRTCSGTTSNCNSCPGGMYLLNGVCLSSCPSGYVSEAGMCTQSNLGNIAYFPFSITFMVFFIIVVYSKANHTKTEMVTTLCGFLGFLVWLSWMVLVFKSASTDTMLDGGSKSLILGMGITSIVFNIALGTIFAIWFKKNFTQDLGFSEWINHADKHLNVYKLIFTLTFVSFPSFRLMYSKLFNRTYFCMFMVKGANFLSATVKFTIIQIVLCLLPIIFVSAYVIYIKLQYDQTLINSIDSLLLNIILIILLIIDAASKDDNFFKEMLQDQPYLRKFKYNQLDNSLVSLREFDENGQPRHKSQLDERDKQDFFRTKINFIENLNKFGHLNLPVPELPGRGRKVKTLPDDLEKLPQLDMNQDEEIKVIDDDFFFEEEEKRRRIDDEERMRLQQQERLRRLKQQEQEKERRRLKMLEDMDQQHSIEFPDLAAIEKVQNKGENLKKSPTHILNKFKKVQDRTISEKEKKKLQEVAKKNGLDEQFMAQTFSIQKHHNPQLLNAIIDKHNHVNRQAVKALFNPDSNPELLQQLFSKTSTMSPQKLRKLMNDPQAAIIIQNLANAEKGIVSPELAKIILDKNSKYSEQFVKQLLKINVQNIKNGENGEKREGIDPQKLKQILKDNPDKNQREAALKAIKKIGGDNLQNKQILQNMLGPDSILQAENFARVGNDLPKKLIQALFSQKSQRNDIIINKILNNKKINLKSLTPILQDPQLLQQLAHALSNGNPDTQSNLINLFKNGENLDPQLLKQLLRNPVLIQKLLSKPIDPAFLSNLLKKDAKTDLTLLEKALENMSDEQIQKVFQFNPEKNVDFEKVAKLFEANMKSDPKLISQFLTPEIIQNVYNKASNTKAQILNKLVEKGKQIDRDSIVRIYGDDNRIGGANYNEKNGVNNNNLGDKNGGNNGGGDRVIGGGNNGGDRVGGGYNRDNSRMGDEEGSKKYNITDNNFNLNNDDEDDELGYKKGMNQNAMSRTDGRMLGFLSPIQVGLQRSKKYSKNGFDPSNPNNKRRNGLGMDLDELGDEQMTQYSIGQQQKQAGEDEDEQVDEFGQRRKKRKLKKKPLDDIRLPSEHIYLQRLQAPHQKKRNIRKKKKKVTSSMQHLQAMDQDNQVYDLDF